MLSWLILIDRQFNHLINLIKNHIILFPENNYGIIPLIGDDSKVDTPLPIPNREVKHFNGENSVSEDSKLPIFFCFKKD